MKSTTSSSTNPTTSSPHCAPTPSQTLPYGVCPGNCSSWRAIRRIRLRVSSHANVSIRQRPVSPKISIERLTLLEIELLRVGIDLFRMLVIEVQIVQTRKIELLILLEIERSIFPGIDPMSCCPKGIESFSIRCLCSILNIVSSTISI
uniref:Uncharacterized protein n=1 Tax=Cacopsylla melanoneura TaxID=428564 RepID=A0A8D8VAI8_9HEMI